MSGRGHVQTVNYAGVDYFRIVAALMVIAIHTAPFSGISKDFDFLLTYCIGRVAVPFFFMTTGYFVLGSWRTSGQNAGGKVVRFIKKTLFLYAVSIVLYLPVNFYSGGLPESAGEFIRMLIFDGTFYHLWYFPAVVIGCFVLMMLLKKLPAGTALGITILLYLIGAGGDSYFGITARIPVPEHMYDVIFAVSSYTRNGIFYAPLFLLMGRLLRERKAGMEKTGNTAGTAGKDNRRGRKNSIVRDISTGWDIAGLCITLSLMLIEGYLTFSLDLQRHNSMYLFLPLVMYFLFRLLLSVPGHAPGWTRDVSMIVYVIHPGVLIVLRGIAGAAGLDWLFVENALVQFISVSAVSFIAAVLIDLGFARIRMRKEARGNV